jgi:hypothetical protein
MPFLIPGSWGWSLTSPWPEIAHNSPGERTGYSILPCVWVASFRTSSLFDELLLSEPMIPLWSDGKKRGSECSWQLAKRMRIQSRICFLYHRIFVFAFCTINYLHRGFGSLETKLRDGSWLELTSPSTQKPWKCSSQILVEVFARLVELNFYQQPSCRRKWLQEVFWYKGCLAEFVRLSNNQMDNFHP